MGERSKCVNLLQKIREIEILSFREEYYTKRIRSTFPNREPFHGPLSFVRRISVFNSGYPPPPNVCSSVSMNSRTGRGDCDNIKHDVSLSLSFPLSRRFLAHKEARIYVAALIYPMARNRGVPRANHAALLSREKQIATGRFLSPPIYHT